MIPRGESLAARVAFGGVAGAALLSLSAAGIADAAAVKLPQRHTSSHIVHFAAPADRTLVRAKVVPVRVTAGPKVTGIRVFAGTKDVSRRFTRHGRAYTARLPRSLFAAGTTELMVQAKARDGRVGGADEVSIIVPGATPTRMRTVSGAGAPGALASGLGAPRTQRPAFGPIPVTLTTKRPTYARLTVNGHRVRDIRAARALTRHSWLVSPRDGLKPGRNTLLAESWDKSGRHSVKRWTVTRSRSMPLTEAGPSERVVEPHAWTTLDGSKSRATRNGAKLTYAWRVVRAPKGATPRLRHATSAKPRFTTDTPGVYQVALKATQSNPGVHAAGAGRAAEDLVTLDAVPALGAQGLYVDTGYYGSDSPDSHAVPFNTLWIEGQPFSATSTDGNPDTFVQLDETTLAVKAAGPDSDITPTAGTITIGAWMNTTIPNLRGLNGSAVWIGTKQVASNTTDDPEGTDGGNGQSNLHGWLQPASIAGADDATWVDSDMLQVKTREPSDTATTNTMEINGTTYPQTLPSGAVGGWQLMVLDNSGEPTTNTVYANGSEDQLAAAISAVGYGYTVLLQAFGNVPALSSASNLANEIQSIGGRADVVDRFNGHADATGGVYALISAASPTAHNKWSTYAADEASFERTGTSGTLSALLVRDAADNDYIPFNSDFGAPDPAGSSRYDFLPLIYAAPTDWTNWIRTDDGTLRAPTTAESAAYSDLLQQVASHDWVPKTQLCPTAPDAIRGEYCDTDAVRLETLLNRISSQLKFNATTAGGRYTEDDWDTVQDTIEDEIGDVANLRSTITDYQALFGTASLDGAVNAPSIGTAIKQAINKSTTVSTNAQLESVLSALTDMASVIPGVGPEMTFISGAFGLMSTIEPDTSTQAVLDAEDVTQDTAATTLVNAFQTASEQLSNYGDLMVDDPVKLQQGALFLMNNDPQTSDSNSAFVHAAEYATQQWLWGTELAPVYSVWVVPRVLGWSPSCVDKNDDFGDPWWNARNDPNGQWISAIGVGSGNLAWHWLLGYDKDTANPSDNWSFADNNKQYLNDISLPGSIADPLFGQPISATTAPSVTANAGAIMPYFALDYLTFKWPPIMPEDKWSQNPTASGCEPHDGIPSTLP